MSQTLLAPRCSPSRLSHLVIVARAVVVLIVLVASWATIPTMVSAQTVDPSFDTPTPDHDGAQVMVDLVNKHRQANGAGTLIHDVSFSDRTEPYGIGLASQFPPPEPPPGWAFTCPTVTAEGGFQHDTSPSIWASMPPGATTWGENIAYRCGAVFSDNVVRAFEALVRSPGHNANMLDRDFTHIAISIVHFGHSTFVVQRFAKAPGGGDPGTTLTAPKVGAVASCLAGRGRVDTFVTNPNAETVSYAVRITGTRGFATTRYIDVPSNARRQITVTGRFDGTHNVAVRPKAEPGATPVTASVEVECSAGDLSLPVVVTDSCLQNNGRIDVHVSNNTTTEKTYVIDVDSGSVRDRSLTLNGGEKGRITVTGRPDGSIPVSVRLDGLLTHRTIVDVDCDN